MCELERPERNAQLLNIQCRRVLKLDLCASAGKDLGGKWMALAANEDGELISETTVSTTSFEAMDPWLRAMAARDNVKPEIVVIDNVPPHHLTSDLRLDSKAVNIVVDCFQLRDADHVLQDQFHVAHSVSPHFNNMHPSFAKFIIVGWREATTFLDPDLERKVDLMLGAGEIAKECTLRGNKTIIRRGTAMTSAEISTMKADGIYHKLFCSSPSVVVPRHVKSKEDLKIDVMRWVSCLSPGTS